MKKIFYLVALVAISFLFIQCEQKSCPCNGACICNNNNESNNSNTENTNKKGIESGHDYIDLGLSVKWATCNIGATKPEEYGYYFAWGEIEPKTYYSAENYKWYDITTKNITKYNNKDNLNTLLPEDDAATINWGGKWRIPTEEEIEELVKNCTLKDTIIEKKIKGYLLTSKIDGYTDCSIFLPCAGFYSDSLYLVNKSFYFWSSTLFSTRSNKEEAYMIKSRTAIEYGGYHSRFIGLSIRPVCP